MDRETGTHYGHHQSGCFNIYLTYLTFLTDHQSGCFNIFNWPPKDSCWLNLWKIYGKMMMEFGEQLWCGKTNAIQVQRTHKDGAFGWWFIIGCTTLDQIYYIMAVQLGMIIIRIKTWGTKPSMRLQSLVERSVKTVETVTWWETWIVQWFPFEGKRYVFLSLIIWSDMSYVLFFSKCIFGFA